MLELLDVEEEGYYYDIPLLPLKQRNSLLLGDAVQLMIHDGKSGEIHRGEVLWFRVIGVEKDFYYGELVETPSKLEYTGKGSRIKFESRHVIATKNGD